MVLDTPGNVVKVKAWLDLVLAGCKCRVTSCKNNRCKCRKKNRPCGPSCQCIGCTIIPEVQAAPDDPQEMEVQDSRTTNL